MKCCHCQTDNSTEATFCRKCGELVVETFFAMLDRCVRDWMRRDHYDFSAVRKWLEQQPGPRVVARCDDSGALILVPKEIAHKTLDIWEEHHRIGKTVDQVLERTKSFEETYRWIECAPIPEVLMRDARSGKLERLTKAVARGRLRILQGALMISESKRSGDQSMAEAGERLIDDGMAECGDRG